MTPERYRRLNELFHSALGRDAAERESFLDRECAGDDALRRQVEAMLAADDGPPDFLDAPAYEAAAPLLLSADDTSLVGRRLAHYLVLAPLGAGGMGDVYLALDTRLGRKVALKLLPAYLSDDMSRVRRFRREARAASALNHPNIPTVYDIGEAEGRHFMATELIEGVTLRRRMGEAPMAPGEVLRVAAQVAAVLSKAHQAGITHRDIKPENIMLDGDDVVKVLDFGLAKYTALAGVSRAGDSSPDSTFTSPGLVMGTPAYMSPEQARGLETDARTDIWSLGVVLYEMVAGCPPFIGPTASDVLAAVLKHEPEPLAGKTFDVPPELERIVVRALRKELSERYQTAEEFAADLERLRRELTAGAGAVHDQPAPHAGGAAPSSAASHERTLPARRRVRAPTGWRVAALLLVVVCVAAASAFAWRWWSSRGAGAGPSAPPPTAAPAARRRLSYWLTVQKQRAGRPFEEPFRLGGPNALKSDYLLRLNLRGSHDGHLYILNEGPWSDGRPPPYVVLFPSPTANEGASLLPAEREIQVPERSWFRFDAGRGTEKVWLVWSATGVPALDAVRGFANPRDRGVVKDPALNRAVAEFLERHAGLPHAAAEDAGKKEMVIEWEGDILAHLLSLEHY